MKKRSERCKHRTLAVVRRSQTLSPRHRPPSRGHYLYLQTQFAEDRFTQFQVIVVIDPPRHTPTHRQDWSQYTALQLAPSVISYPRSQSKSTTPACPPTFQTNEWLLSHWILLLMLLTRTKRTTVHLAVIFEETLDFVTAKDDGDWRWWVVTTGAIRRAKFQSNHHHQQTNTQFYYRPDAQPTVSKHWRESKLPTS